MPRKKQGFPTKQTNHMQACKDHMRSAEPARTEAPRNLSLRHDSRMAAA